MKPNSHIIGIKWKRESGKKDAIHFREKKGGKSRGIFKDTVISDKRKRITPCIVYLKSHPGLTNVYRIIQS